MYYFNPYYPMRPNGTHAKLIGDDFIPHVHKWVEIEIPSGGRIIRRNVFVLEATSGVDSVQVLQCPNLRPATIDAKMVLSVSESSNPPRCAGGNRDYYNGYYNGYYNFY